MASPTTRRRPVAHQRPSPSVPAEREQRRLAAVAAAPAGEVAPVKAERKPITAFKIEPNKPVEDRWLNMMIYGPFGHGKTTFAGTADDVPEMRDVLFINADSGTMSLTHRRSMDFININKYTQLARIFEYLTLHCRLRDEGKIDKLLMYERELKSNVIPLKDQTPPVAEGRTWFEEQRLRTGKPMDEPYLYRTTILDSISELHKYLVYKYTGVDIGSTKLDEEIERMEEWQPAQELFRLLIRSFRDLPMNTIFVSAEALVEADRKKGRLRSQYLPKLAGQMAGDIAGFVDIVGYLTREIEPGGETHRYLYLGAGYPEWISKHRFENLPDLDFVEDPTLASLIELARKDAEHGTSQARRNDTPVAVPTARHRTSAAAPVSSRSASNASSSRRRAGRDHTVRRPG